MSGNAGIVSKIRRGGNVAANQTICLVCGLSPKTQTARVGRYLEGLAAACLEAARDPRLLPTLLGVLRLAPKTILGPVDQVEVSVENVERRLKR
jgi:hypothetical protein